MQDLFADARFGCRMLLKSPGATLVTLLTLALCIGANTAMFTLVNAVLLRPLPYKDSNRMVWVTEYMPHAGFLETLGPDYVGWSSQSHSLEQIAAYDSESFNVSGIGEPLRVEAGEVSSTFFPLFSVRPLSGRTFSSAEDRPGSERVAVLTYAFVQNHMDPGKDVLGSSILLNGTPYRIVGVLPKNFEFPDRSVKPDLLIPLPLPPYNSADESFRIVSVIGRLATSSTIQQATTEFGAINRQFHGPDQKNNWLEGMTVQITSLQEHFVGSTRRPLIVLLVAVGFVLLIGCANVANLQLARATSRQREIAVRTALGATRVRLIRQLLTESFLLSAIGGFAGLLLAKLGISILAKAHIQALPYLFSVRIDGPVLGFTALLIIAASVGFGLAPAFFTTKNGFGQRLHSGGPRMTFGTHQRRLSGTLVISQLALAMVLLAGAGLLIRTFVRLIKSDPGFEAKGVLTAQIMLPEAKYTNRKMRNQFFEQLLPRLRSLPGVDAAAVGSSLPLADHGMHGIVRAEGQPELPPAVAPSLFIDTVSEGYFRALGMSLIEGRSFIPHDATPDLPPPVILNQAAARKLFPGQSAVGKHVEMGRSNEWWEVVGVVGDVRDVGLDQENSPEMYLPLSGGSPPTKIVLHTLGDPATLAAALQREVQDVDIDQPIFDVVTMANRIADSLASRKFNMSVLTGFASLAFMLAAIGIYGVISFNVGQRTHEIGIRLALGAQRERVLRLVIGNGMFLGLTGVAFGLLGALSLSRYMSSLLYGISSSDLFTLSSVSLLLLVTALLASYIPARRAAKVDPVIALRYE